MRVYPGDHDVAEAVQQHDEREQDPARVGGELACRYVRDKGEAEHDPEKDP